MQQIEILKLIAESFAELNHKMSILIERCGEPEQQETPLTKAVEALKGACEEQLRTEVKNIMQGKLKSGAMSRAELKQLITDMGKTALSDLDSDELVKLKTKLGE